MTQLQPGDKVKLVDVYYVHDTVGATYYVYKTLLDAAYLTNDKNLATPIHTFEEDGCFCLFYRLTAFEPLPKEKKGFVSFIRKLEGAS